MPGNYMLFVGYVTTWAYIINEGVLQQLVSGQDDVSFERVVIHIRQFQRLKYSLT